MNYSKISELFDFKFDVKLNAKEAIERGEFSIQKNTKNLLL